MGADVSHLEDCPAVALILPVAPGTRRRRRLFAHAVAHPAAAFLPR